MESISKKLLDQPNKLMKQVRQQDLIRKI